MDQVVERNTFFDYHFYQLGPQVFLNPTVTELRRWVCDRVPVEEDTDHQDGQITGVEAGIIFIGFQSALVTAENINAGHAILRAECSTDGGSTWQKIAELQLDGGTPPSEMSQGMNAFLPLTTISVPCVQVIFRITLDMSTTAALDSINTRYLTTEMLFNPLNQQELNPAV